MKPRHFWWLVETLEKRADGPSFDGETRAALFDVMARAERGEI